MVVKRINLCALDTGSLTLGYVGENDHTQIRINCASVFSDYPTATASMLVKAPSGVVYPKEITTDGNVIVWTVSDSDTASAGTGQIQLTFTEDGVIVKTVIAVTNVRASLVGDNPPPDPITDWIEEADTILNKVDGMTATATELQPGDPPTAEVKTVEGHYNIAFGIPTGDPTAIIDDNAGAGDVTKVWSADKTAGEVSELKSAIDGKAPCIFRDASGDIVSFEDGANGMPLKSCVVSIDPVQTGSGDPAPDNVRPISGWTGCTVTVANGDDPTATGYSATEYPVSWQTAAGTVYGGSLTVHQDGTGTLTVTRVMDDMGDLDWTYNASYDYPYFTSRNLPSPARIRTNDVVGVFACERYKPLKNTTAANFRTSNYDGRICINSGISTAYRLIVQDSAYTDETLFKQAVTGIKVVTRINPSAYPVYQLTAAEVGQIMTLPGYNSIWADTGAISLTYPADTQTYVDDAISAATDPDGNIVTVMGSTPSITGESGKRYVCGTVDSISITPPQTGIIDVVFTSGTTPAVLTATGVTWPSWFNPNSLNASTVYDTTIKDGYGVVNTWA